MNLLFTGLEKLAVMFFIPMSLWKPFKLARKRWSRCLNSDSVEICLAYICVWFVLQDFLSHATDGLFTQGGFNDRAQDLPSTQNHYGLGGLQSQVGGVCWHLSWNQWCFIIYQRHLFLVFIWSLSFDYGFYVYCWSVFWRHDFSNLYHHMLVYKCI